MSIISELLKKYNKIESGHGEGLEYSEKSVIIETDQFDDLDWSDIELKPTDLPKWVQSELNTHIPSFVKDGDVIPRNVGDLTYIVKYINKLDLDYIVIAIEKIKKD